MVLGQAAVQSNGLFNKDDWQCAMCGNVNWSRRDTCNVCNHSKDAKIDSRAGYVEVHHGTWDTCPDLITLSDRSESR